jgi:hypothetical protein
MEPTASRAAPIRTRTSKAGNCSEYFAPHPDTLE